MTTRNERIAQAMSAAGFETQTALSRAAGVPQPTISRICSGAHSIPDTTTLQKIAKACGVSVQWLLEGTGDFLPPAATSGDASALLDAALRAAQAWANAEYARARLIGKGRAGINDQCDEAEVAARAAITALASSSNSAVPGDEKQQDSEPGARTDVNVEEERAKFDAFMKPFEPRSQFRLREDGAYASKAMRERFDGWLCARSLRTAPLPMTGIKVVDITQLQRDLARHAAGGNIDVAATCVQAQAVIEGLLSGLDAGQLA